jgi:hypothetical protein
MTTKKIVQKKSSSPKKVAPKKTIRERKTSVKKETPSSLSKKVVSKKLHSSVPSKKVSSKKEKCLCDGKKASQDQCFWVFNGPVVDSIENLKIAISFMSKEQYLYHASKEKNDFSVWIRDVFDCSCCAEKLLHAKSQKEAYTILSLCCGKK